MNKLVLKNFYKRILLIFFLFILMYSFSMAKDLPEGELPILITPSGQSPDAVVIKVLLDRVKIDSYYNDLIEADEIEGYKTIIIVMGGSTKGLGAAGIDEKFEIDRTKKILDEAEKQGVLILGIHIGGEGRRGPLSMQFIEVVAPRVQGLIVTEEGNKDDYFTKLSEEKKIPLVILKTTPEIGEVLKELFKASIQ